MTSTKQMCSILAAAGWMLSTAAISAEEAIERDLPRELEFELALSALPDHLRADATVYLLDESKRYRVARNGSNGFHTLVSRNDPNAFSASWPFTDYRDDLLIPIAFDQAGATAHMQVYLDMADLRAAGMPAAELKATVNRRYETGHYRAPSRPGLSYMLSPVVRTYVDAEASDQVTTWNVPHYMFYAPGISNEEIGGKPMSQHPYVLNRSPGPHGYIIKFAGEKERAAITEEHSKMIERVCQVRDVYCLEDRSQ